MKTKLDLSIAQRFGLARMFLSEVGRHIVYARMGTTLRALMGDMVRLYFVPFKSPHTPLPPIEVEHIYKKDQDGNVVEDKYIFELDLVMPMISGKGTDIKIEKEIKRVTLESML